MKYVKVKVEKKYVSVTTTLYFAIDPLIFLQINPVNTKPLHIDHLRTLMN